MARWATLIEIAGQSFTGCRAEIVNAEEFDSDHRGSTVWANDGTADNQIVAITDRPFGIQFVNTEIPDFVAARNAIKTAIAARGLFEVHITDELYDIHANCDVDWSDNGKWVTHGQAAEGWVPNVLFRFITKEVL